jgi:hypothetical protein
MEPILDGDKMYPVANCIIITGDRVSELGNPGGDRRAKVSADLRRQGISFLTADGADNVQQYLSRINAFHEFVRILYRPS